MEEHRAPTVTLTKAEPTTSLRKTGASPNGKLCVNLDWSSQQGRHGFLGSFRKSAPVDLDLGCLYELTDGSRGVIQALGKAFRLPKGSRKPLILLDADDRTGDTEGGENLWIDLAQLASIRRILVFAYIYAGIPRWADADAVATLIPPSGPQIKIRLDEARKGAPTCAIALLENDQGDLSIHREVNYVSGHQRELDSEYKWGMTWVDGRK